MKNSAMKEVKRNSSTRVALVSDDITSMAQQNTDAVISIGGRSWRFPGAKIDTNSWEGEFHGDGRMHLHDDTGAVIEGIEVDNPEDAGVLAIPSPQERRLREINLARLILVMVDIVLAGDPLGLETARDLGRELRHTYPELVDELL